MRDADLAVGDEAAAGEDSVAGRRGVSIGGTLELSWMPKLARLPLELSDDGTRPPELIPAALPAGRAAGVAAILNSGF